MAQILTFFLVALVCSIGFLVGGAGAAPLGLTNYVPRRHYDCLGDRLMQDSSCYLSRDLFGLGIGNRWKRSNDAVTLYQRPSEVQVPPKSGARPLSNTETLESTTTWKKAVLMKLGSLLRSAKKQGTGVGQILTNLWNWVVKTAKRMWLAPGYEKWRVAEIEKLDTRAKELEAKIAAARLGAINGANVQGTEPVLTPTIIDLPDQEITVGVVGSILDLHKQELELAVRPKTAQDLEDQQSIAPAYVRKPGMNSDSALPGTPNSPQRQSRGSAGLESAKEQFRPYQDGLMQVGIRRPATARQASGKLDNMLHYLPTVPTPEASIPSKGDEARSAETEATVKPLRRPNSPAVPIPHPKREDEDDSPDGPGVATAVVVEDASEVESPDECERAITTEYPAELLEAEATPAVPAPTVRSEDDAHLAENALAMDDGLPIESFTQEELLEYSGVGKAVDLSAALANRGNLIVTPEGLIESRGKLIDRVQKNEQRIKLRKDAAEVGVIEAGPAVTHDAAAPVQKDSTTAISEVVPPGLAVTLTAHPSVSARLAGWLDLGSVAPVPSSKSTGHRMILNTLEDEVLDKEAQRQSQMVYNQWYASLKDDKEAVPFSEGARAVEGTTIATELFKPQAVPNVNGASEGQRLDRGRGGEPVIMRRADGTVLTPSHQHISKGPAVRREYKSRILRTLPPHDPTW
ncbi:hypothetical protein EV426DRAFT_570252 [Tirmania nivea]|nr:hypothetical protein EV426DRAFT_570252 [Tirmania nivea]